MGGGFADLGQDAPAAVKLSLVPGAFSALKPGGEAERSTWETIRISSQKARS